jgi:hypothetical protein
MKYIFQQNHNVFGTVFVSLGNEYERNEEGSMRSRDRGSEVDRSYFRYNVFSWYEKLFKIRYRETANGTGIGAYDGILKTSLASFC